MGKLNEDTNRVFMVLLALAGLICLVGVVAWTGEVRILSAIILATVTILLDRRIWPGK